MCLNVPHQQKFIQLKKQINIFKQKQEEEKRLCEKWKLLLKIYIFYNFQLALTWKRENESIMNFKAFVTEVTTKNDKRNENDDSMNFFPDSMV